MTFKVVLLKEVSVEEQLSALYKILENHKEDGVSIILKSDQDPMFLKKFLLMQAFIEFEDKTVCRIWKPSEESINLIIKQISILEKIKLKLKMKNL